jgi:hypothetical protein
MRRCLPLLAMSLSLPAAAEAPDWKLISRSGQPGQMIHWYVDTGSIVRTDDYLRAVLRTSWSRPQLGPDNTLYQSSTYLNYFDCDKRKIAYTANAYFRSVEPEGGAVHEEPELPLTKLTFQSVVPGSTGALRLDFVCNYQSKQFLTYRYEKKARV